MGKKFVKGNKTIEVSPDELKKNFDSILEELSKPKYFIPSGENKDEPGTQKKE